MRPRLPKEWVDVIEDDQIGRPMQIYRTDCLSLKRNMLLGRLLKVAGHLPNSNWTEIIQYGVPYRAQHERHQHREKVVEEYHKEINDTVDCSINVVSKSQRKKGVRKKHSTSSTADLQCHLNILRMCEHFPCVKWIFIRSVIVAWHVISEEYTQV